VHSVLISGKKSVLKVFASGQMVAILNAGAEPTGVVARWEASGYKGLLTQAALERGLQADG
jgi:hypothetical protein